MFTNRAAHTRTRGAGMTLLRALFGIPVEMALLVYVLNVTFASQNESPILWHFYVKTIFYQKYINYFSLIRNIS